MNFGTIKTLQLDFYIKMSNATYMIIATYQDYIF